MTSRRLSHIDALKALAAQVIVLHHLVSYGPIARAAHTALPLLSHAMHQYGRMAVQIFLVVGGYLSARGLSPRGQALQAADDEEDLHRHAAVLVHRMRQQRQRRMGGAGDGAVADQVVQHDDLGRDGFQRIDVRQSAGGVGHSVWTKRTGLRGQARCFGHVKLYRRSPRGNPAVAGCHEEGRRGFA